MTKEQGTFVDFVARTDSPDEWRIVLVEEGPWRETSEAELRKIQDRLYGCIDAAVDGQLADQFPETIGKYIVIQMDCYDLPKSKVLEFFENFSQGVLKVPDYKNAISRSKFVSGIGFDISFEH